MSLAWLALLPPLLSGAALFALLVDQPQRWSRPSRLGLSLGLGLLVNAQALFLASLAGWLPAPWIGLTTALVLTFAAVVRRGRGLVSLLAREERSPEVTASTWRVFDGGLLVVVVTAGLAMTAASLYEPVVEWDVIAIWAYKARVLLGETLRDGSYLHDASRGFTHLDYPLLWPLSLSWVWAVVGEVNLMAPKVLAPVTWFGLLATLHGFAARAGDRRTALLVTALCASVPMVTSQAARLMPDLTLAWFWLAAAAGCHRWLTTGESDSLRLGGAFAAAILLTKNEGMALFAILFSTVAAGWRWRHSGATLARGLVWLVALPTAIATPWLVVRAGIPKIVENYGSSLFSAEAADRLARLPLVLRRLPLYLGDVADWGLVWPALLVLFLVSSRHALRRRRLGLVAASVLPLVLYVYVIAVSPQETLWLMESAVSRLFLQALPLLLLVLAEIVQAGDVLPWQRSRRPDSTVREDAD